MSVASGAERRARLTLKRRLLLRLVGRVHHVREREGEAAEQNQEHRHDDQQLDQREALLATDPAQLIVTADAIVAGEPVEALKVVVPDVTP